MNRLRINSALVLTILFVFALSLACSRKSKKEEECETQKKVESSAKNLPAPKNNRVHIKRGSRQQVGDMDWCRACVVGPHGFMSCQRVSATSKEDTRDDLRQRARIKACMDSGFTKESCPDESVIAIACKDDKPFKDKTAAGKKVLKALKKSGPLVLSSDPDVVKRIKAGAKPDSKSPQEEKDPKKADPK